MTRYASQTSVPVDRTRTEIERTLVRYGATGFGYVWQGDRMEIRFELASRTIVFGLRLPGRDDPEITRTATGKPRSGTSAAAAYEAVQRQRWRALLLIVKAKLEAIDSGVVTLEEEFLAHMLTPDGRTVGDVLIPQLDAIYARGQIPALLPGAGA